MAGVGLLDLNIDLVQQHQVLVGVLIVLSFLDSPGCCSDSLGTMLHTEMLASLSRGPQELLG